MRTSAIVTLALVAAAQAVRDCPPLHRGSFDLDQYQLYPENADWDAGSCQVWWGALLNASVAVYDPYADKMVEILEFPNITHSTTYHIGGVGWDQYSGLVSILVDSIEAFVTLGNDTSGTNLIMKWDPKAHKLLWTLNLTETTQGRYGGFQDVEHDPDGHTYIVGSFPGTIMRVDPKGRTVTPWYLPPVINTTQNGYTGLAAVGHTLLAPNSDGQLHRFDMRDSRGHPVVVPMTPFVAYSDLDAIYLPPAYEGTVLLAASNANGIVVLRSTDGWNTCEYRGIIAIPRDRPTEQGTVFCAAAVQMGDRSQYMVLEFLDDRVPGQDAGNRTRWPMPDITSQVEALLVA